MNKGEKEDTTDKKLIIAGIIIILIIAIVFSLTYLQEPNEPEVIYHHDVPILDESGEEVGGVHLVGYEYPIEDVSVTLINETLSVWSSHELSEGIFICKNTSFKLIYEDNNNDGLFSRGDFMYVSGQTTGSVVKFIHSNGKCISETTFL
jgi:hypothetical protein